MNVVPPPATASAVERPHVLIVTNDSDLHTFLAEGLLLAGFWTSTVADAIQTLEVFRLRGFDLVIVDASLPGLGAVELVQRLRGRSSRTATTVPRTSVPIVILAGSPDEVDWDVAVQAGASLLLTAPVELETIALSLQTLLHQ